MPVRDEAANLAWLLPDLVSRYRTIVIDNDSRDGSADIARSHGAEVLRCADRGVGRALHMALAHLGESGRRYPTPQVIVVVDADGSFCPKDFADFAKPILEHKCQLVYSRLCPKGGDRLPLLRRLGQIAERLLLYALIGRQPAAYGSLVAADYDALRALELEDPSWAWLAEIRVKASLLNLRTQESDVCYRRRRFGHSKLSGSPCLAVAVGLRVAWATVHYWLKAKTLLRNLHWSRDASN